MITVYYKVFNEADYLKESMESIYPYCDKMVMLEYCLPTMKMVIKADRATKEGLSTDGTTEIIQEFYDPDKKIEHKKWGFVDYDENVVYQIMSDMTQMGEYAWVMDGDIVYPDSLAKTICKLAKIKKYDVMWIPEVVFMFDLDHIKRDWTLAHQRVYRKISNMYFYIPGCYEVHWIALTTGKLLRWYDREERNNFEEGVSFTKNFISEEQFTRMRADEEVKDIADFAFHYSYARDTQRILEKLLSQYYMIDVKWDNKEAMEQCSRYKDALDWRMNTMVSFIKDTYDTIRRYSEQTWYRGHPQTMANNKWNDYKWDGQPINISYEEAKEMVNVVQEF